MIGALFGHYRVVTLSHDSDEENGLIGARMAWVIFWPILEAMMNFITVREWWAAYKRRRK